MIDPVEFMKLAHTGQLRKFDASPYWHHPMQVMVNTSKILGLRAADYATEPVLVAALLHDVVEDTDVSLAAVEALYGPVVARTVDAVTKRPEDGTYAAGFIRGRVVPAGLWAVAIKLGDVRHNMSDLDANHSLMGRYREAEEILQKALDKLTQ